MSEQGVWVVFGRDLWGFAYAHMVVNDEHSALFYAEDASAASRHLTEVGFEAVFVPFATTIDYDGDNGGVCVREILGGDPNDIRNVGVRARNAGMDVA